MLSTKSLNEYKWSSYNEYINRNEIIIQRQKDFVLSYFNKDIKRFSMFHHKEDCNEYLEIQEDLETQRLNYAKNILQGYLDQHGISDKKEISKNPHHLGVIIKDLLTNSKLSHRKIADLLEVNRGEVHRAKVED